MSSYDELIRVVARMHRFVAMCRRCAVDGSNAHCQVELDVATRIEIAASRRDTFPTFRRLGRVLEVLPGKDGVVRVARVLTSCGVVTRPAVKLVLLPVNSAGSLP